MMKKLLPVVLLGLNLLLACINLPDGCTARQSIIAAFQEFDLLEIRANAVVPGELAPVIEDMESARQAMEQLKPGACEQEVFEAHTRLMEWMDAEIVTFSAVMQNDITDLPLLKWHIQDGLAKRALAQAGVERIMGR
jgi:hypothetical protein